MFVKIFSKSRMNNQFLPTENEGCRPLKFLEGCDGKDSFRPGKDMLITWKVEILSLMGELEE
jgi:hypothetical protein